MFLISQFGAFTRATGMFRKDTWGQAAELASYQELYTLAKKTKTTWTKVLKGRKKPFPQVRNITRILHPERGNVAALAPLAKYLKMHSFKNGYFVGFLQEDNEGAYLSALIHEVGTSPYSSYRRPRPSSQILNRLRGSPYYPSQRTIREGFVMPARRHFAITLAMMAGEFKELPNLIAKQVMFKATTGAKYFARSAVRV